MSLFLQSSRCWTLVPAVLLLLRGSDAANSRANIGDPSFPEAMHVRAAILTNTVPLAYVDESARNDSIPFSTYRGFQPDLLRQLQTIALDMHNITLTYDLEEAPAFSYSAMFELVASDCNTSIDNSIPLEDCNKYDAIFGDYYAMSPRPLRVHFSPNFLTTSAAAVKYVHRVKRDVTTFAEALVLKEPICLLKESFYDEITLDKYPGMLSIRCETHAECINWLKGERCVLFVEDELQLRYATVNDPEIEITRETFSEQFVLWPFNKRVMAELHRELFFQWMYQAKASGALDALYVTYFSVHYCPVGFAGSDCTASCNPSHGISDRFGRCICDSNRWVGADCATELYEDQHLLPSSLISICYAMVGVNYLICLVCAIWLYFQRNRAQIKIAQPSFLLLILLGCIISSSTILALAQEDAGDGPVQACMAIPWLYSVGFSITLGTLFAKVGLDDGLTHADLAWLP
jgi:ABC-type amino acid transport substrate-binding protein